MREHEPLSKRSQTQSGLPSKMEESGVVETHPVRGRPVSSRCQVTCLGHSPRWRSGEVPTPSPFGPIRFQGGPCTLQVPTPWRRAKESNPTREGDPLSRRS